MQPYWAKMKFSLLLLLLCLSTGCKSHTMQDQYFLEIELKSENTKYYIDFNDTKVFSESSRKPVNFTLPLNHWVLNGKNTLLISVDFGEGDKLKAASEMDFIANINMRVKTNGQELTRPISQFFLKSSKDEPNLLASRSSGARRLNSDQVFLSDESGDVIVSEWKRKEIGKWMDFNQTIQLDLNYPKWAYLDADYLGDPETMSDDEFYGLSDDLYLAYQEIWQLMKDKNKDELLKRFALRASEFDKAFYLKPGEKLDDMDYSLTSAFNHDSLRLDGLQGTEVSQLTIEADGKIAVLRAASSDEALISYSHPEGAYHRLYDMYFMRKEGKWIVIR